MYGTVSVWVGVHVPEQIRIEGVLSELWIGQVWLCAIMANVCTVCVPICIWGRISENINMSVLAYE